MRCLVCDSTDKWVNVDQYRMKPSGMSICSECGFVSYPSKWKSEEEIKAHYRKDYRKPPTHNNFFTGQRKIYFHHKFLNDVFNSWKAMNLQNPKVFEIGAAYGLALQWIRDAYKGCEVSGTELTTSYRRNAFHEFGIDLKEDFDSTKKYDLIMSYKVAEHQLDVDKQLRKYAECLTDNGLLYISVPTWFDTMCNFGVSGFDLEYYYDPNHINVWTKEHFEYLLKKAGLEVIKSDYVMYDSTYLCKRNDSLMSEKTYKADYQSIIQKMERIKKAYQLFIEQNFDAAIVQYSDYPVAHINLIEKLRKQCSENGWDWTKENIINKAMGACPTSVEIVAMACDFAMRFNQWEEAVKYAEDALQMKPENPSVLHMLVNIMREMALRSEDPNAKVHYFKQGRDIATHLRNVSSQHFREALDLIYLFNSHIPTESENVQV